MIWIIFAIMALAVLVALLWPLVRNPAEAASRAAYDVTVFRDQLEEVDRDLVRGVVNIAEAEAARVEIQRRMISAGRLPETAARQESPQTRAVLTAGLAVTVPFAALALYLSVGAPQLTGRVAATATAEHGNAEVAGLVEKLAARVREAPDNPEGWALLARSYRQMERFADAAEAYRNLMRLEPDQADGFAGFGEVSVAAAGGAVSPEAHAAFVHALELDRAEPRARFYLGLEQAQAGDARGALTIWRELTASAAPDAAWLPMVRSQMAEVAQSASIMPMSVQPQHPLDFLRSPPTAPVPAKTAAATPPPSTPGDPTSPDVGALKDRFSSENLEMIQGMVGGLAGRLENNPDDYNGWLMLARSYTVLKKPAEAAGAYRRAIALQPAEVAPKVQLLGLLLDGSDLSQAPRGDVVALAEDIRARDANQADALFVVGLAKAKSGDPREARRLWEQAARGLPADAPLKAELSRRLEALR